MSPERLSFEKKLGSPIITVGACAAILVCYLLLYPATQPDHFKFLLPWLRAITGSDGLSAFATDFSNYTGGYVSVLAAFSLLEPIASELAIIKLTSVFGACLSAFGIKLCLSAAGWDKSAAINGGLLFLLLPAVMLNGIGWGQADTFYTAFVLYSMAAMMKNRPLLAALMFAVAVSIKLQAILFAPVLLGYLMQRSRYLVIGVFALIPVYLLVNTIYLVAGRPIMDVLLIYAGQAQTFTRLSMNAGNLWLFVDYLTPSETLAEYHKVLVLCGIVVAALVSLLLGLQSYRTRSNPFRLLVLAATTTLLLPFILPKMHDRFFFMAEVFLFLTCLLDRRYIPPAIIAQLSAICMYSIYHDTLLVRYYIGWPIVGIAGVLMMMYTIVFVLRMDSSQKRDSP